MSRDLVSGLFWLAVAIFAALQGLSLNLGSLNRPGPGFFPFWGGVVLGVLSVVLIVRSFRRATARPPRRPESWKLLVVLGALLAYLLLLFRLEQRGWAFSAVTAAIGTLASYALFQVWLKTQLPTGPLGF